MCQQRRLYQCRSRGSYSSSSDGGGADDDSREAREGADDDRDGADGDSREGAAVVAARAERLAQDWSKEVVLAVPPPAVLLQTLVKFQEDRSRGMIVFPDCGVGLLESAWSSKILKKGKLAEWRFKGSGRLGANVSTRYNERFEGKLVLVKVNFQN